MKWIYPMSRYSIAIERNHKNPPPGWERRINADYGYDHVDGFFCQVFEWGKTEPFYWATGEKSAIIDSPVWTTITTEYPEHAEKIILDLPF